MKAKFIGDPRVPGEANNLPESMTAYGVTFPRGKFVDVPAGMEAKFEGNSHFETRGGNRNGSEAVDADNDDDGKDDRETVAELEARIATSDDAAALEAELASEKRVTARSALQARIDALKAE